MLQQVWPRAVRKSWAEARILYDARVLHKTCAGTAGGRGALPAVDVAGVEAAGCAEGVLAHLQPRDQQRLQQRAHDAARNLGDQKHSSATQCQPVPLAAYSCLCFARKGDLYPATALSNCPAWASSAT